MEISYGSARLHVHRAAWPLVWKVTSSFFGDLSSGAQDNKHFKPIVFIKNAAFKRVLIICIFFFITVVHAKSFRGPQRAHVVDAAAEAFLSIN